MHPEACANSRKCNYYRCVLNQFTSSYPDGVFLRLRLPARRVRIAVLTLLGLALLALLSSQLVAQAQARYSVILHVTFSKQAAARLAALNEGVMASASFAGVPVPSHQKEADEAGQIDLGNEEVTVKGQPGVATITGAKVNRSRLAWTSGPVLLNVNVYSARRALADNILACDFFDGKLESAHRRPVQLHCTLITEQVETRHIE
jgi:hypothetical protein